MNTELTIRARPRLLTIEALEAVRNYFWAVDSPVLSEAEVQDLVEAALKDIKTNALDDGTLQWAAQWILDTLKGETDERVIEFAKNMAMTLRAARLAPQPALDAGEQWRVAQRFDGAVIIVNDTNNRQKPILELGKTQEDADLAARIVSDHFAASSVTKLVEALKGLLAIWPELELPEDGTVTEAQVVDATRAADSALTIANQGKWQA